VWGVEGSVGDAHGGLGDGRARRWAWSLSRGAVAAGYAGCRVVWTTVEAESAENESRGPSRPPLMFSFSIRWQVIRNRQRGLLWDTIVLHAGCS